MRCAERRSSARSATATAITVAVAVAMLAACTTRGVQSPASPTRTATAAVTPSPSGLQAIRVGTASAGQWTTTAFEPTLRFTIPSDGWLFFFPDENDEMAVGKSGGIELTASRIARVVDPASHKAVPAPDDLVAWLASHPDLHGETPTVATIGGIEGQAIQVTNAGSTDVDIFAFDAGNLRVSGGTTALITVLPYDGPDLVFCAFAPEATFEGALPELQSVLDSIEIDGS